MVELSTRQRKILIQLLEEQHPVTTTNIAQNIKVSTRTIHYDLEHINQMLKTYQITLKKKPKTGVWLHGDEDQKVKILNDVLHPHLRETNALTQQDRVHMILLHLLKANHPVTSGELADQLLVSKTTIIKDLKLVKSTLETANIRLVSKPRVGYEIEGQEKDIREFITKLIVTDRSTQELLDFLLKRNDNQTYFSFDELNISKTIKIDEIKNVLSEIKKHYQFYMPDSSFASLLVHLSVAIDRMKKGKKIYLSNQKLVNLKNHDEYAIAQAISYRLEEKYNLEIPETEVANITYHLISSNLKFTFLQENQLPLSQVVEKMLANVNQDLDLSETNTKQLVADLTSHLTFSIKKLKLGIELTNPLLDEIKTNYIDMYQIAQQMAKTFSEEMNIELPEPEVGYITLYIASKAELHQKDKNHFKSLVVCTTGEGSASILATRIEETFPTIQIIDSISAFDLEENEQLLEDIDFILSTVNIHFSHKPVIKVSPIITEQEIHQIKRMIGDLEDPLPDKQAKSSPVPNEDSIENFAYECTLLFADIGEIFTNQIHSKIDYKQMWGFLIHIMMAIPRWKREEFTEHETDTINKFTSHEKEYFETLKRKLIPVAKKYDLTISDSEIISMMKYFYEEDSIDTKASH